MPLIAASSVAGSGTGVALEVNEAVAVQFMLSPHAFGGFMSSVNEKEDGCVKPCAASPEKVTLFS